MRLSKSNPLLLLGSDQALKPSNHIFFFVLAVLTLGFFDVERLGGNFGSWFVVFMFGFVATVLSIEAGKKFLIRGSSIFFRSIQAASVLLVSGFIRGVLIFYVGNLIGVIPADDLVFRLVGGPIFVFSTYLVSNSLLASFAQFRDESNRLFGERERLARSQTSCASDLELVTQQQRNQVSDLLLPAMWELQKKLETATNPQRVQDALLTMQSLNNEVVRPLSRELAERVGSPLLEAVEAELPGPSQPKLADRIRLADVQPPLLYFGIVALLGLNSQIALNEVNDGITIVALGMAPLAVMFLVERLTVGKKLLPVATALFLSGMLGGIAGFLGGILVSFSGLSSSTIFVWQSTLLASILKSANTVFGMYLEGWRVSVEQLKEVNEIQKMVNSRLRQQVWLGQKSLAMELHGSVQATLQALAMRLSRMKEPDPQELEIILSTVRQSLSRIENQDYLAGQDVAQLLNELRELWEGTAEVRWNANKEAKKVLQTDLGLARSAFEVIRESVTNAVKHGGAKKISISIVAHEKSLGVSVTNNGELSIKNSDSLGAELMDQLCLRSELKVIGKKIVFEAELATNPQLWRVSGS